MLIALEGMDGVGKSTLTKMVASSISGYPVVKAIHPLRDTAIHHDNFLNVAELVLRSDRHRFEQCMFGVRGIFLYLRLNDEPIVSDRFYASNLWHVERRDIDIERLVSFIGIPETTILLCASRNVLFRRIHSRNPHDKDLEKIAQTEAAYEIMKLRFEQYKIPFEEINTDKKDLNEIVRMILSKSRWHTKQLFNGSYIAFSFAPAKIHSVKIPLDIGSIDAKAFFFLKYLSAIKVEYGHSNFASHRGVLYSKDKKTLLCYPCRKKYLSYSVDSLTDQIAPSAFLNACFLRNINLPVRLREIGSTAFFGCKSLKSVHIPQSTTDIGPMNFLGCDSLKRFTVDKENPCFRAIRGILFNRDGSSVLRYPAARKGTVYFCSCSRIGSWAFAEIRFLNSVSISDSIEGIDAYAFVKAEISEVIAEGTHLTHIGEKCFAFCRNLSRVELRNVPANLDIHSEAFDGCPDKLRVYIPLETLNMLWNNPKKEKLYHRLYSIVDGKKKYTCGEACLQYILRKERVPFPLPRRGLRWIFDMASILMDIFPEQIKLFYKDSRIIGDFAENQLSRRFSGYKAIRNYLSSGGVFQAHTDFFGTLREMLDEYYVITLADSSTLFDTPSLSSSHYIVILEIHDDCVLILNPMNTVVVEQIISAEKLCKCCATQGNWLLCVPRKKVSR